MKTIVGIIVLAALVWGGYMLFGNSEPEVATPSANQSSQTVNVTVPTTNTSTATSTPTNTATPATNTTNPIVIPEVKQFTVVGQNFSFNPSTITVNKGDRVRIVFQSQGTHDWVIDEFKARTNILNTGQSQTIEFVADKTGSFEYYCSVGSHRQMGMEGTLIVK